MTVCRAVSANVYRIARTLLREPDLLILDEAASNLDTLVEAALHRALERNTQERTIIHIAHRLGKIRAVDRIFVFDAGMIIAEGTHDELMTRCTLYAQLIAQSGAGTGGGATEAATEFAEIESVPARG